MHSYLLVTQILSWVVVSSSCDYIKFGKEIIQKEEVESKSSEEIALEWSQQVTLVAKAKPTKKVVADSYKMTTVLKADKDIEIAPTVGRVVGKVRKRLGDFVKRGDEIALLQSEEIDINFRRSRLELSNHERIHRNDRKLFEAGHIPKEKWEETQLNYHRAQLAYEEQKVLKNSLSLKSPINGVIARNDLRPLTLVASYAKEAPLRVISNRFVVGSIAVPALYLQNFRRGQIVWITGRGIRKKGVIEKISPVVDIKTGTFVAEFRVRNNKKSLLVGEQVQVEVPLSKGEEYLVLPENSVVFEGEKSVIFVMRDSTEEEVKKEYDNIKKTYPEIKAEELPQIERTKRASKVAVRIKQLPNGEYAFLEVDDQGGDAADSSKVGEGTEILVIGISQVADGALVKPAGEG